MEGETVTLQDAFSFDYSAGVDADGRFLGKPVPTGVRPRFTDRFDELGIDAAGSVFAVPPARGDWEAYGEHDVSRSASSSRCSRCWRSCFLVIAPPVRRVSIERRTRPAHRASLGAEQGDRQTVADDRVGEVAASAGGASGEGALELAGVAHASPDFVLIVFSMAAVLAVIGVLLGFGSWWSVVWACWSLALAAPLASVYLGSPTGRRRAAFADQLDDSLQLDGRQPAGRAQPPRRSTRCRRTRTARRRRSSPGSSTRRGSGGTSAAPWTSTAARMQRRLHLGRPGDRDPPRGRRQPRRGAAAPAATIRERNQIRRQVKALCAEGKLSAIVLMALPLRCSSASSSSNPGYLAKFTESIVGWIALAVAVMLMVDRHRVDALRRQSEVLGGACMTRLSRDRGRRHRRRAARLPALRGDSLEGRCRRCSRTAHEVERQRVRAPELLAVARGRHAEAGTRAGFSARSHAGRVASGPRVAPLLAWSRQ